jgi:hypothetical protein
MIMVYCKLQYTAILAPPIRLSSTLVATREDVMLTQAERGELKRYIADILNDTRLPPYLKVNRLAELLEDQLIERELGIPAFEEPTSPMLPPTRPPARKQPAHQAPAKRKSANSTRASTRKKG